MVYGIIYLLHTFLVYILAFPSFVEANIDIFIFLVFDYVVLVYYVFIRPGLLARYLVNQFYLK